ncbi:MAG: hypothetical protein RI955_467, partial [Bacteroidota bacterium]
MLFVNFVALAQTKSATLSGIITDAKNNQGLFPANVYLKGTMYGAQTDINGKYTIINIPAGEYTVEVSSVGFERQVFTAIRFMADEKKEINASISSLSITGKEVKIIGEKPLIDVDNGKTQKNISRDVIDAAPVKNIQNILN